MRYAIYFAPPAASPLWQQGSQWLGRDALSGRSLPQPHFRGIDPERFVELTASAAHYGFHATLVPPFRLAGRNSEADLLIALADFSLCQKSLPLPPLEIGQLDRFFCLRPIRHLPPLQTLASLSIRAFDRFRAPLTPSELARRKAAMLSGQEKKNLEIWGYPYVFEQFRFHFSLTSPMAAGREMELIHAALIETFRPMLAGPLVLDALCLFIEPEPGQPMRCIHRFPFFLSSSESEECIHHDQQLLPQDLYPGYQCHPA